MFDLYRLLAEKNVEAAELEIRDWVKKPEHDEQTFHQAKTWAKSLFQITITVEGANGERIVGNAGNIFDIPTFPESVQQIFFDSASYYKSRRNMEPRNSFGVLLDFRKPGLLDFQAPTTARTPNNSNIIVGGDSDTWVNAVFQRVTGFCDDRSNRRAYLHQPNLYDKLIVLAGIPLAFWLISNVSVVIDSLFSSIDNVIKYGAYVYTLLATLFFFRFLFNYAKWAYPSIEFERQKDAAAKHRKVLGAIGVALVGSIMYDFLS